MKLIADCPETATFWPWRIWRLESGHYAKVVRRTDHRSLAVVISAGIHEYKGRTDVTMDSPLAKDNFSFPTERAAKAAYDHPDAIILETSL